MSGKDKELKMSRRSFVKNAAAMAAGAAGAAVVGFSSPEAEASEKFTSPRDVQDIAETLKDKNVKVVHSVCLGCNARCGTRVLTKDGRLIGNYGNPYHPYNTRFAPIAYDMPVKESLLHSGSVCGKSKESRNYAYNPYRLIKPLKRSGPRGSGKFEPIEWEQMIKEIAEGGALFEHIGEKRMIEGVKALNSDKLIDAGAPELGTVRNGFIFIGGRDQNARKEFSDRFVKGALGSCNRIGHTDICGIGFRMGNWIMSNKKEVEFKADPVNSEFIAVFGANIYEALQPGINTYGATVANRNSKGEVRFIIVDPRATNASVHSEDWIAVQPTRDGALAMGMLRWIIDNNRYNGAFLAAPNTEAASKAGFACFTNASYLVITDPAHKNYRKFLRVADINANADEKESKDPVVADSAGMFASALKTEKANLLFSGTVKDSSGKSVSVKSAFVLMREGVFKFTVDEYAEKAGVKTADIVKLADRFTSNGTKSAVTQYHGAGNYIGGTYAAYAVAVLNALVGSVDRKGGYMKAGGGAGKWNTGIYDLALFEGARKPSGPVISREKFAYEKTTEFKKNGYPAKRPWFPMSVGGLCVEAMSGIDQKYPYPCKILMTYFFNPVYSIPGGYRYKETLSDTEKVPLHVSIDITVNESNIFADYIVPDVVYSEGHYGFLTPHAPASRFTGIRTPAVEPVTGKTKDGRHFSEETFLIDLAIASGLPGFGENAIKDKNGNMFPLKKAEDFYLRAISNLADSAKVPEASDEETAFVEKNYPVAGFKNMLSASEWKKVCYALARGGVFNTSYNDVFTGENHKFGIKEILLYSEELALTKNSITGENFSGTLKYVQPVTPKGRNIDEIDKEYPFSVITYKMNVHAQSRTHFHKWSMELFPENYIEMNDKDAATLGIRDMDSVRLISASNKDGITGKVKVTKLVRKGCLGISNHYGHTQMGASDLPISKAREVFYGGKAVAEKDRLIGNKKLGSGLQFNNVARLDEDFGNTPMVDVVGGTPDFSSTRVKVIRL
ncbi:molybdopterin-dependent oxidoreductase [Seleniivibrio woodruffii]|uniref:Tetrathionate reductase subunit A n=1 Tax=Seleniivibrio woodruffii TaxID=1078050 RepID=A0A4R1K308_9BACT|nr:molybdopterin-dependent oxidoreductase [Seleniivibrio woodruffii]TCK58412.1 tetrathionate reductase subunit A [Seleniivibrio woodruffii]TVZ36785.1 tetrathionate reductase alpha subunit precursor [Seleniivibrio woodruffii]